MSRQVSSNNFENPTVMFLNCHKCDPDRRSLLSVGLSDKSTLVIWCDRHNRPVAELPVDASSVLDGDDFFYCDGCDKKHYLNDPSMKEVH